VDCCAYRRRVRNFWNFDRPAENVGHQLQQERVLLCNSAGHDDFFNRSAARREML
jgi:hypothetical protein